MPNIFVWGRGRAGERVKKRLCKIKYGFEGSISNLDQGLLNFSVLGEMEKKLGCGLVGGSVPRLKPFSDTERL